MSVGEKPNGGGAASRSIGNAVKEKSCTVIVSVALLGASFFLRWARSGGSRSIRHRSAECQAAHCAIPALRMHSSQHDERARKDAEQHSDGRDFAVLPAELLCVRSRSADSYACRVCRHGKVGRVVENRANERGLGRARRQDRDGCERLRCADGKTGASASLPSADRWTRPVDALRVICSPPAFVEYARYVVGGRVLPVDAGAVCCPRLTDASVPVTRPASCPPPTPGAADVVTGTAPASIVSSVVVAPAGSTEYTTVLPLR